MNRRTVLRQFGAVGAIGLAGCTSPPTASSATHSPESTDIQRRVSITGQASISEEHHLRIEATMLEATITESHTARIEITVTNEGPARGINLHPTGGCALFHKSSQSSTPRGLWLAPVEEANYVSGTGWIANPPEGGFYPDYGCGLRAYDPGASVQNEYEMYHDNRTDGHLQPGEYRFQETVFVVPGESHEEWDRNADAAFTVPWEVSVSLTGPNCALIC